MSQINLPDEKVSSHLFSKMIDEDILLIETKRKYNKNDVFTISDSSNRSLYVRAKEILVSGIIFKKYMIRFELTGMIRVDETDHYMSTPVRSEIYSSSNIINLESIPRIHKIHDNGQIERSFQLKSFDITTMRIILSSDKREYTLSLQHIDYAV